MKTNDNTNRLKTYKIKNHDSGKTYAVKAVSYTDAVKKYNKHILKDSEMKLVDEKTGKEIKKGDIVTSRGEKWKVISWTAPRHSGSSGKVYAEKLDSDWSQELYPGVFGLKFVNSTTDSTKDAITEDAIWNPDFYLKKEPQYEEARNAIKKVLWNSSLTPEEITLSVYGSVIRFEKNMKLDASQMKAFINQQLSKINPSLKAEKFRSMAGKIAFEITGYEYLKKHLKDSITEDALRLNNNNYESYDKFGAGTNYNPKDLYEYMKKNNVKEYYILGTNKEKSELYEIMHKLDGKYFKTFRQRSLNSVTPDGEYYDYYISVSLKDSLTQGSLTEDAEIMFTASIVFASDKPKTKGTNKGYTGGSYGGGNFNVNQTIGDVITNFYNSMKKDFDDASSANIRVTKLSITQYTQGDRNSFHQSTNIREVEGKAVQSAIQIGNSIKLSKYMKDSITEDADKVMGTYKGYTIKQNVDGDIYVLKKSGEKQFFESWKKAHEAIKTGAIKDSITEDADIAQNDIKSTYLPEDANADNIQYLGFNEKRKLSFYSYGDRYFVHYDLEGRTEEIDKKTVQKILKKNILGEIDENDLINKEPQAEEIVSDSFDWKNKQERGDK